jgi:hypothetical protein
MMKAEVDDTTITTNKRGMGTAVGETGMIATDS